MLSSRPLRPRGDRVWSRIVRVRCCINKFGMRYRYFEESQLQSCRLGKITHRAQKIPKKTLGFTKIVQHGLRNCSNGSTYFNQESSIVPGGLILSTTPATLYRQYWRKGKEYQLYPAHERSGHAPRFGASL